MKSDFRLILGTALLAFGLTACGGSNSGGVSTVPAPPSSPEPDATSLLTLSKPTSFSTIMDNQRDVAKVAYDPATKTYTYSSPQFPDQLKFGPKDLCDDVSCNDDPTLNEYGLLDPKNGDRIWPSVLTPGDQNKYIKLQYTSVATVWRDTPTAPPGDIVVFGLKTNVGMPRTGTAKYTGVALASTKFGANNTGYLGESALEADFGTGKFTHSMNLRRADNGEEWVSTGPALPTIRHQGTINSSDFNGTALNGTGTLTGSFFGPRADEYGATFTFQGSGGALGPVDLKGLALGKKQ